MRCLMDGVTVEVVCADRNGQSLQHAAQASGSRLEFVRARCATGMKFPFPVTLPEVLDGRLHGTLGATEMPPAGPSD